MAVNVYQALTQNSGYTAIVLKTYREYAGTNPATPYGVYYEISDAKDKDIEGVQKTGSTRIQLDVVANSPTTAKDGVEAAIQALQDSEITLTSATARAKGYDATTKRYGHSVDLFIQY